MTDRVTQIVKLHRRAIHLESALKDKAKNSRFSISRPPSRELASQFNALWRDVKKTLNDADFEYAIRPAWCVEIYPHGIMGVLFLTSILAISLFLLYQYDLLLQGFVAIIAMAFGTVLISATAGWNWLLASSFEQLHEKAISLEKYIRDYIELEPAISSKIRFKNEANLESQIRSLQTVRQNLESILEDTRLDYEEEIKRLKKEVAIWQQKWTRFQTPSNFDIPQGALDKLDDIEKVKLIEAVQAYRVGAWTPAASVCGTILEGRLQRLCRENDLPTGGIGQMIRQLGEKGLLKDYYHNLAKVGEFFRHRSSHPTSEEFDKEKVSVILTSLVILVRDLF